MQWLRRLLVLLVTVGIGAGGSYLYFVYGRDSDDTPKYRVARIERGPLTAVVASTGTLQAVVQVQVGSQVTGKIHALYVDFNSRVKKGQLIAQIDPESFEARVTQARAQLEAARATVLNQEANVERSRSEISSARAVAAGGRARVADVQASFAEAKRQVERKTELAQKGFIAQAELETSQASLESMRAQVEAARAQADSQVESVRSVESLLRVSIAQVESARAQVREREAALRQAEVDLAYTRIVAPVDGVVVARNVDVGQTVAASLSAPILFMIAQDLTKMEVYANVDESDVGLVAIGQSVRFTVEAFKGHTFSGTVMQIRKSPQLMSNVVSYAVIVSALNPEGRLLPGMTANVRIVVYQAASALKVPNQALRFRGEDEMKGRARTSGAAAAAPSAVNGAAPLPPGALPGKVWLPAADGQLRRVDLRIGSNDGSFSEVLDGALREGDEVIVGVQDSGARRRFRIRL